MLTEWAQGDGVAGGILRFLGSPSSTHTYLIRHSNLADNYPDKLIGGSITLSSSNPFDYPLIDDGNLQSRVDIAAFTEGIRLVKRFFTGDQWTSPSSSPSGPYLTSQLFPDPDATLEADFETFLRQSVNTGLHGVGTAEMSKRNAKGGVVDPELKVKGLEGLRIVDASVIPRVPAGHTQVPVYVLAERASDLIKATWA